MSELHGHSVASLPSEESDQNQKHLEQTEEELLDQLVTWLEEVDEEHCSQAQLNALLTGLEAVNPSGDWFDVDEAFKDFQYRFGDLFETDVDRAALQTSIREQGKQGRGQKGNSKFSTWKKVVAVIALLIALSFPSMLVAEAFGFHIFGAIGRWSEETFQYIGNRKDIVPEGAPPAPVEDTAFNSLEEALVVGGLPAEMAPTGILEGFHFDSAKVFTPPRRVVVFVNYENEDGLSYFLTIHQFDDPSGISSYRFEKDDTPVELYTSGDKTFYIMKNYENYTAVWSDGKAYMITIGASMPKDLLIQVIDSFA